MHQSEQRRHLDERTDHANERLSRIEAKNGDGHGDRQLEIITRGGKGKRCRF